MTNLPVESALQEIKSVLGSVGAAVLVAPPGAGKTTRVPLALLGEAWLGDGRIVLLEPRRLAARAAANRMADMLGEPVGRTVGYRMRLDTCVSKATRIEVVTEGVLTRMLQSDPALEGVGLVIFDEYHERSLQADLGLALCLQSREFLRDDLRVLVMSATLDAGPVAGLLGGAPVIESEGRAYPVETHYLAHSPEGRMEETVARAIRRAIEKDQGDVLAFLPGAGEIRRTAALLESLPARVMPLFGDLPREAQDAAIRPGDPGSRKVVLATSIAETSLTIDGIRVVVDSGYMRTPRFSPRSGMTRLETRRVTRANADQRRGRAGRLGPGTCYRLWTRHDHEHLARHTRPEILEVDLAALALELTSWGVTDPGELRWLDPPPEAAWNQAMDLLGMLGALDSSGQVTPHGRAMATFGTHPRLAHALLRSTERGFGATACRTVALLSERDIFRTAGDLRDADLRLRLEAVEAVRNGRRTQADTGAARRILLEERDYRRRLEIRDSEAIDVNACGLTIALAYPERVAQQRQPGRFSLRNGRTAVLGTEQPLADHAFLALADLDGQAVESRIFLAAPIDVDEIRHLFNDQVERENVVRWDELSERVVARRQERLGALILRQGPLKEVDTAERVRAVIEGIRKRGILPWTDDALRLRQRMLFIARLEEGWPDVSDEALLGSLEDWLGPFLSDVRSREDLERIDLAAALQGMLTWEQRRYLDQAAPAHWTVPTGSQIRIDYTDPAQPVLAVRLQEMFGATETPRIASGRVPLTLHLLSPAHRPVQVTQDLEGFWRTSYFDVRKDMRGRYPKHYWPDDPHTAEPTRRARRSG